MDIPSVGQEREFRGQKYTFVGDPTIKCNCLANGHRCDQQAMAPSEPDCFIGKMDSEGFLCTRIWKVVKDNQPEEQVEFWSDSNIDTLMRQCYTFFGAVPFLESYAHTNMVHWKIRNTHTRYREDKRVLGTMEEGLLHSLKMAIKELSKVKAQYLAELEDDKGGSRDLPY